MVKTQKWGSPPPFTGKQEEGAPHSSLNAHIPLSEKRVFIKGSTFFLECTHPFDWEKKRVVIEGATLDHWPRIDWPYPLGHWIPYNNLLFLYFMSYFTLALFPMCYIFSLSLSLAYFCFFGAYLLSLPFCLVSTLYSFALVHVHFSHSAHHITTPV